MDKKLSAASNKTWKRKLKTLTLRSFFSIVLIYTLIWITSPFFIHYFLSDTLKNHFKLELSDQASIRYNPFTSHLSVRDLEINKLDNTVFSIDKLDVEIRLHRLIMDELFVSQFDVKGLMIASELNSKTQIIAGIDLAAVKDDVQVSELDKLPKENASSELNIKKETSSFQVVIPKSNLEDVMLKVNLNGISHQLKLETFSIGQALFSETIQDAIIDLKGHIDQGNLAVSSSGKINDLTGNGMFKLHLDGFRLEDISQFLPESARSLVGKLSFSMNQTWQINSEKIIINIPQILVEISKLELNSSNTKVKSIKQKFSMLDSKVGLALKDENSLLQSLTIAKVLLHSAQTDVISTQLTIQNSNVDLAVEDIKLANQKASQPMNVFANRLVLNLGKSLVTNDSLDLSTNGETLTISDMSLVNEKILVDKILLDGLDGKFILKPAEKTDKGLPNNHYGTLASTTNEKNRASKDKDKKDKTKIQPGSPLISVNKVSFINGEPILFEDQSVSPTYKRSITLSKLELTSLNSELPDQPSSFSMKGTSDQYTQLNLSGDIKPFKDKVNLNLELKLKELALPPENVYVQNMLGFEFESGELDSDVNIKIVDSKISGNTLINIRGLALASAGNYDADNLKQQTAMPLNVALGMLKDDDDNVELDIPMLGNIDNPSFGISSFIALVTKKAIQAAAKNYLIKTFIPYSEIVSLTISAGDLILKTRFEDLKFEPKQIEFSEKQMPYINQFIALMKDKKNTQVKVCAISSRNDIDENSIDGIPQDELIVQLKNIAKQRMEYFKNYMVKKGIESSRLLLCAPKVDLSKENEARITISV